MVAYAPYVAGTAALSSYNIIPTGLPGGFNATSTVKTDDFCALKTVTVYEYADEPTSYPTSNSHGHGGPYYNPYNDIPQPVVWPGFPSKGEKTPGPRPTDPLPYGGPAKDDYYSPAWIPKGHDKLDGSLPGNKQDGDSYWGDIDCPHLPVTGLPKYPTTTGAPYPTGSGYAPGYPSASGSGYYPSAYPSGYSGVDLSDSGYTSIPYPTGSGVISGYPSGTISVSLSTGASVYPSNSANSTITTSANSTTSATACPTMPDTGVTRTYDMTVAYQTIAPDGVTRNGLVVNGQFPGPLVEANW